MPHHIWMIFNWSPHHVQCTIIVVQIAYAQDVCMCHVWETCLFAWNLFSFCVLAPARLFAVRDPWAVLELSPGASRDEVKKVTWKKTEKIEWFDGLDLRVGKFDGRECYTSWDRTASADTCSRVKQALALLRHYRYSLVGQLFGNLDTVVSLRLWLLKKCLLVRLWTCSILVTHSWWVMGWCHLRPGLSIAVKFNSSTGVQGKDPKGTSWCWWHCPGVQGGLGESGQGLT